MLTRRKAYAALFRYACLLRYFRHYADFHYFFMHDRHTPRYFAAADFHICYIHTRRYAIIRCYATLMISTITHTPAMSHTRHISYSCMRFATLFFMLPFHAAFATQNMLRARHACYYAAMLDADATICCLLMPYASYAALKSAL